jgi:hypothetical protein
MSASGHAYTETLDRALAIAEPVTRASLYLSLVVIYFWFGGMKVSVARVTSGDFSNKST